MLYCISSDTFGTPPCQEESHTGYNGLFYDFPYWPAPASPCPQKSIWLSFPPAPHTPTPPPPSPPTPPPLPLPRSMPGVVPPTCQNRSWRPQSSPQSPPRAIPAFVNTSMSALVNASAACTNAGEDTSANASHLCIVNHNRRICRLPVGAALFCLSIDIAVCCADVNFLVR